MRDRFRFMKENKDIIKIIFSEVLTNEQLKQKIIIGAEEVFKERRLDEFFECVKQNNPEINKELTLPEIMRPVSGALITYFIQRFIVFDGVICETEEHDLDVIERQIYNCWTI